MKKFASLALALVMLLALAACGEGSAATDPPASEDPRAGLTAYELEDAAVVYLPEGGETYYEEQTDPLPTIVMGDFNAKPNSKAVRIMRENLPGYQNVQLQDVYDFLDSVIGNTYHGFKGKIKQKFKPIDYIFVSDDFEIVRASVDTTCYDGAYPSDHYPVSATLRLKS